MKRKALSKQIGGSHYKDRAIQPCEFVHANNVPYLEGSAIYYLLRHKQKNGAKDIRKVIHTCELILALEYGEEP
jgi:hypothetical protein